MPNHYPSVVVGAPPDSILARPEPAASIDVVAAVPERPAQSDTSSIERPFRAGLIAGILGYGVAAVFFAVASRIEGRTSFDLATLLRGTLFLGADAGPAAGPSAMTVTGPVFVYNGPRLVTFLLAGVFIAWLASIAERAPQVWLVAFMLLLFVAAPVLGLPTVFEAQVQAELSPWVITSAMTLAAMAMAVYLRHVYPALRIVVPVAVPS